jgi:hypothetical protein
VVVRVRAILVEAFNGVRIRLLCPTRRRTLIPIARPFVHATSAEVVITARLGLAIAKQGIHMVGVAAVGGADVGVA